MGYEVSFATLMGAVVGGFLIYWIASLFTQNPVVLASIVLAVAVVDFLARSDYLPLGRFVIFATYCVVGGVSIFIGHRRRKSKPPR